MLTRINFNEVNVMLIKDKSFYRMLFTIAIPITLQNLINVAVTIVDTLMLGRLGEVELSASALSNQLFFIYIVVNFGLSGGANILIAQYWGKGDVNSIHKIVGLMLKVCTAIAFVFTAIAMFFPRAFLSIFTADIAVIDAGEIYLRIMGLGYFFAGAMLCLVTTFRSVKTVNIAMWIYLVSFVVNIALNWLLIFGNLGFPALGIVGAAIATVVSRIVSFIIIIVYALKFDTKLKINKHIFACTDAMLTKDFIKTCTPVTVNELIWTIGTSMVAVIVGRLGTEVVAANSISSVVNQFVTVFIYGLSGSASVIIGNSIGEQDYDRTKRSTVTLFVCVASTAVIASVCTYLMRPFVVSMYNVSELTKSIAMDIMTVNAVMLVFQTMANVVHVGMLRAGGDAKFVLVNDVIFMWLITIPLGFVSAFVWGLPIVAVFYIIRMDEVLKVSTATYRLFSWKWINNLTR
ncbi:MAG: MATE family efflux transporter [Epulopiscium sp. Nele67-Bin001]|nr:MAG: MATE family efflux transporter [Epulopiscium sp. Nele67-Bin001]